MGFLLLVLAAREAVAEVLPPADVISATVPCSALMIAPLGICRTSVIGMNLPLISTNTSPLTGSALNDPPSFGGGGGGSSFVVNVASGPNVMPALLVATSRTWYSALGTSPESDATTAWLEKSDPTLCEGVDWS